MAIGSRALTVVGGVSARIAAGIREHPRVAVAGTGSVVAAIGATIARRKASDVPALPSAVAVAADAAASVHNAAKGSVLAAVREQDTPELSTALNAVREAIAEAALAGADLTSAALGAVEGMLVVAEDLGETRAGAGRAGAEAAWVAADVIGSVAARRVGEVLQPIFRT